MVALNKIAYNQDGLFILLLLSFLLIAILKGFYWKYARLFFMGIFAQRYSNQYLRQENAFTQRVGLLTFLLLVINFSIVILSFQFTINIKNILSILFYVLSFFLIKMILITLIGLLFKSIDLAKLVSFFSFLFDKTLAFVLFPIILVNCFFSIDISSIMLIVIGVFFISLYILKVLWLWNLGVKLFGLSQIYIFLYLCMFEIFPLIVLGKGVFY